MEIDFDPSLATNFFSFNPMFNDNALSGSAQKNSVNMGFFKNFETYNNTDVNIYDIKLSAYSENALLSSSKIQILQGTTSVPEPSTFAIFALDIMGLASRRFKK